MNSLASMVPASMDHVQFQNGVWICLGVAVVLAIILAIWTRSVSILFSGSFLFFLIGFFILNMIAYGLGGILIAIGFVVGAIVLIAFTVGW